MGATGWAYFAPYQANVEDVLQELRKGVFERGEYGHTHAIAHDALAAMPAQLREAVQRLRELEAQRLGGPSRKFRSIDDLLEASAENGTHSILDIRHTASGPGFGVAWPAPLVTVGAVYGTEKPTRADIQKAGQGALESAMKLERWQAVFVIAYDQHRPCELYFEGVSGD